MRYKKGDIIDLKEGLAEITGIVSINDFYLYEIMWYDNIKCVSSINCNVLDMWNLNILELYQEALLEI